MSKKKKRIGIKTLAEIEKAIEALEKYIMQEDSKMTNIPTNLIGEVNRKFLEDGYIDSAIRVRNTLKWVTGKK